MIVCFSKLNNNAYILDLAKGKEPEKSAYERNDSIVVDWKKRKNELEGVSGSLQL